MNEIGIYRNRKVIWTDYNEILNGKIPKDDWICLVTSSVNKPDYNTFDKFTRSSIQHGILEFKGHGAYGEILHDWFDETIHIMEVMENHSEIDVMTTWHNNQSYADSFWQCFFSTCLPDYTNYNNLKILCLDLDGINREQELKSYINHFEDGWLPEN